MAHCGLTTAGFYLNTLTVVDVATGWTELEALWGVGQQRVAQWAEQYQAIRKQPWFPPLSRNPRTLLGCLPRPALAHFVRAALNPVRYLLGSVEPPLGPSFDSGLWSLSSTDRPADPVTAELVDLAQSEFRAGRYAAAAAVARLTRAHAPDEAAPQRLLAHASPWSPSGEPLADQRVGTHAALGDAHRRRGNKERAVAEYRSALALDGNCLPAHMGLAKLHMPGDDYSAWLDRLQEALRPETYVEIGIATGRTLALARPPTRVFGVDPEPSVTSQLRTETHIFAETSDAFFAERRLEGLLAGLPLKLAFLDGRHSFEQSLRDFMHLKACCGPTSAILLHNTVPLDEPTQRRERETTFWTGDVWKTVLALKHYRPDLDIVTIAAAPTGLTVVTGLDPAVWAALEGGEREAGVRLTRWKPPGRAEDTQRGERH